MPVCFISLKHAHGLSDVRCNSIVFPGLMAYHRIPKRCARPNSRTHSVRHRAIKDDDATLNFNATAHLIRRGFPWSSQMRFHLPRWIQTSQNCKTMYLQSRDLIPWHDMPLQVADCHHRLPLLLNLNHDSHHPATSCSNNSHHTMDPGNPLYWQSYRHPVR